MHIMWVRGESLLRFKLQVKGQCDRKRQEIRLRGWIKAKKEEDGIKPKMQQLKVEQLIG